MLINDVKKTSRFKYQIICYDHVLRDSITSCLDTSSKISEQTTSSLVSYKLDSNRSRRLFNRTSALSKSSDQTSRFEDSRARVEWYQSNMRAKLCFARWHSQNLILWKCSKQSLDETSFFSFLIKFLKCHWFKKSSMTMFTRSLEVHFQAKKWTSSLEKIDFKSSMKRVWT